MTTWQERDGTWTLATSMGLPIETGLTRKDAHKRIREFYADAR